MSDILIIGDYTYSSWSLRGWLLFERFGLKVDLRTVDFNEASVAQHLADLAPARTVPTLVSADGSVLWDSLAIAETLAEENPDAGLWPKDRALRILARNLTAEMHSGFTALRGACPMNLSTAFSGVVPSEAVQADLTRIDTLFSHALERSGGPWLCGEYSVADVFFAPVAARIAGYGLEVGETAQTYVARHLADPAFRRWRALGLVTGTELARYAQPHDTASWPGPTPRPARPVDSGTPENDACPYSGKTPTHLLEIDGRIFGFCNATCRDKTVADPEAWPAFVALLGN